MVDLFFKGANNEKATRRRLQEEDYKKKITRAKLKGIVFVLIFGLITSILPISFTKAMTSESYWNGSIYPQTLIDNGSTSAGLKASSCEYVFHPTSNWTSLAMDLESGNFLMQANLVNVKGTSLPITFGLTYNSFNASEDIGMGKGWTSNIHSCLSEDNQTGDITYITSTGAKLLFDYDSQTTSYLNPKGFKGQIEILPSGEYKITSLNGESLTFDSNGKLTQIDPLCGLGISITYTSGRPVSVTDMLNSSRTYTLAWNVTGKLTSVTDGMNQVWTLGYDANENKLTSITKPGVSAPDCSFGYDNNYKLTSHEDFEGFTYDVAYEASSPYKVSSWDQPSDETTSFSYASSTTPYSKKTTVTDAESHAVEYYFGITSGRLDKIKQTNGAEELKRSFGYNASGWVTSIKDSYDNEMIYSYDDVGHITSQTYPPTEATAFVKEWTYSPEDDIAGLLTQYREKVTSVLWNRYLSS